MTKINQGIKELVRIFPEGGRKAYLRLDMNENPEGIPKDFVEEVKEQITPEFLATYPEPQEMTAALAEYHHISEDCFALSDGSEMAIKHVFEVFAVPGSNVVTVTPSFAMYGVFCSMYGVEHRAVAIGEDFRFPEQAFLSAIDSKTSLVVLLSPNNPVGGVPRRSFVEAVLAKAADCGATVVIDEAYHDFSSESYLELVPTHENLIVFRTFSKLFSLASCRLGYAVASPENAALLNKVRPTFEVNALALLFGKAILQRTDLRDELIKKEKEGRSYLVQELSNHGYHPIDGGGNYILFRPHHAPHELEEMLKQKKILVKTYGKGSLLGDFLRISTGSRSVMEQFLEVFLPLDQGGE